MSERRIDITEYIESRLEEWGSWSKRTGLPKLGYKSNSNAAEILGTTIQGNGLEVYESKSAEEMEKILRKMLESLKGEAKAIIDYYSTDNDKSKIARKHKVSLRCFNYRLKNGKAYIAGCLTYSKSGG